MSTRSRVDFPADLARARKRFERARRIRKARSRLPEPLWAAAVKLADRHGINRTAQALRLDYYSLKKRVERNAAAHPLPSATPPTAASSAKAVARAASSKKDAAGAFIELPPLVRAHSGEGVSGSCTCILEWEEAGGAKLRLHFPGIAATDLATLCRSLRR